MIKSKFIEHRVVSPLAHATEAEEDINPEARWIAEAQVDPAAFEPLYRRYHIPIYHYLRTRINNDDDAADLTHQVFYQDWTVTVTQLAAPVPLPKNDPNRGTGPGYVSYNSPDPSVKPWIFTFHMP